MPSRAARSVKSAVSVNTTARLRKSAGKLVQSIAGRSAGRPFARRRRYAISRFVRAPRGLKIAIRPRPRR